MLCQRPGSSDCQLKITIIKRWLFAEPLAAESSVFTQSVNEDLRYQLVPMPRANKYRAG
jgi:hypothetical protein